MCRYGGRPTSDSYDCALDRLELLYGGRRRLLSEAIQNVREGRVIDEENVSDVKRFLAVLESTAVTLKETGHQAELTEGGALLECAKDRMPRGFLREYTKWTMARSINASFGSLIDFLTEWINVLSSSITARPKYPFLMRLLAKVKKNEILLSVRIVCGTRTSYTHQSSTTWMLARILNP